MTDEYKIRLADMVLDFVSSASEDRKNLPRHIGYLKEKMGPIIGFKPLNEGTPVFDTGDKYLLIMESLDGKRNVEMTYYKKKDELFPYFASLEDYINFI